MATRSRRTKAKRAPRKTAAKKTRAAKRAAASGRQAASKRASKRPQRASPKRGTRVAARKGAAKRPAKAAGKRASRTAAAKSGKARTTARRPQSAEAKKQIAGEHLRELLEQKKQREAQVPAWQRIEHHDHAPRAPDTLPPAPASHPGLEREGDLAEVSVANPKPPMER